MQNIKSFYFDKIYQVTHRMLRNVDNMSYVELLENNTLVSTSAKESLDITEYTIALGILISLNY